jgi:hypothetical protein
MRFSTCAKVKRIKKRNIIKFYLFYLIILLHVCSFMDTSTLHTEYF